MHPTPILRWLILRNPVTADEVRARSMACGEPMQRAKAALENRQPPVLQQQWADDTCQVTEWRDVPTVCEAHDARS